MTNGIVMVFIVRDAEFKSHITTNTPFKAVIVPIS